MKKVLIFLGIIVFLFAAISFLTNMQNKEKVEGNPYGKDKLKPATIGLLDDKNYQNIILPKELETKVANKEDVTVYFFQSDCEWCKEATPILMPLAEELGIDLVQYNLTEFEQGWDKYQIEGTPTIIQFKDGKQYNRIENFQEEDIYRNWFEENSL